MNQKPEQNDDPLTDTILNTLMVGGMALVCGLIVVLQSAQAFIA